MGHPLSTIPLLARVCRIISFVSNAVMKLLLIKHMPTSPDNMVLTQLVLLNDKAQREQILMSVPPTRRPSSRPHAAQFPLTSDSPTTLPHFSHTYSVLHSVSLHGHPAAKSGSHRLLARTFWSPLSLLAFDL